MHILMELNPLWTVVIGPFIFKLMTYLKGRIKVDVPLLWSGTMVVLNVIAVMTANWLFEWGLDSTTMLPYIMFGVAGTEISHKTVKTVNKHTLLNTGASNG